MRTTTNSTPTSENGSSRRLAIGLAMWAAVALLATVGLLALSPQEFRQLIAAIWGTFGVAVLLGATLLVIATAVVDIIAAYNGYGRSSLKALKVVRNAGLVTTFIIAAATIVYTVVYGCHAPLTLPGVFGSLGLMVILRISSVLPVRKTDEA
jgi:hypothetical protein